MSKCLQPSTAVKAWAGVQLEARLATDPELAARLDGYLEELRELCPEGPVPLPAFEPWPLTPSAPPTTPARVSEHRPAPAGWLMSGLLAAAALLFFASLERPTSPRPGPTGASDDPVVVFEDLKLAEGYAGSMSLSTAAASEVVFIWLESEAR